MCGLAGFINFNNEPYESNKVMLEMLKVQKHRGPDDAGILGINTNDQSIRELDTSNVVTITNDANMVMGFNRLSILDLSKNGHQPMTGADNKVILMMNGEIYNAFDYKEILISKGYKFKSRTDTEVVLNLYLEHGFDKMIKMLNGMFAIALIDLRENKLFLARDRYGIKPLYVVQSEKWLAFSSELKSFKAIPGFSFELDKDKLDEFMLFRNLINRTLIKGIINLTPGEYWSYSLEGDKSKVAYYNLRSEGIGELNMNDSLDKLDEALKNSVKRQLMSDVKLGSQLSGGVDSSLVSYYAAQNLGEGQLETISILFDNPNFTEETYIDYVADELHLQSHKYTLDPDYYINQLDKATWHFENPLNHPNTIGIYLLSSEAKKHVTVLLSGEGADETMAGYGRFIRNVSNHYFSTNFFSELKRNKNKLGTFFKYYIDDDYRMLMSSVFTSINVATNLLPEFTFNSATNYRYHIAQKIKDSGINKHRKFEILTYLPDLLMRQDKMSMAHSIENRVPFLDNEFVTAAFNLTHEDLISKNGNKQEGKFLLKQLCANRFNKEFAFRAKMGFGIPLQEFMQSEIYKTRLNDEWLPGIEKRGIFNAGLVKKWANDIGKLNPQERDGLWLMTSFEIWAQQFLTI